MGRLRKGILVAGALCAAASSQGQVSGYGLKFDGTTGYANCGTANQLSFGGTAPFTIEAWVRTGPLLVEPSQRMILSKYNLGVAGAWQFSVAHENRIGFSREVSPFFMFGNSAVPLREWHHVAAVYDGSEMRVYLDGVLDASSSRGSSNTTTTQPVLIGAQQSHNVISHLFNGTMDELRVWNVGRTRQQLVAGMNATLSGSEAGLVGYWPMDALVDLGAMGGGADDIEDRSTNNNHGDLVGGVSLVTSDLVVAIAAEPDPGMQTTYTVIVHNDGPMRASSVTATLQFPAELAFVSTTLGLEEYSVWNGTLTAALGNLADQQYVVFDVVLADGAEPYPTVEVSAWQSEPDMQPADNVSSSRVIAGQTIHLADVGTAHPGLRILGRAGGDNLGYGISGAGDVNGDGLADVIVGVPHRKIGDTGNGSSIIDQTGEAFVVFGAPQGSVVETETLGTKGFRIATAGPQSRTGCSVSGGGDFNGDGFDDLVVGAPEMFTPDGQYPGECFVVFGKADVATVDLADPGTVAIRIMANAAEDAHLGYSVSGAGDVNGDGLADIAVGAVIASPDGREGAGKSYVVFGRTDTATIDLSALGDGGFAIKGATADSRLGTSVSGTGDVNGDGLGDLLVGVPFADPDSIYAGGEAWVVFGKKDSATVDLAEIGEAGFPIVGAYSFDLLGYRVSGAGDVNGDGRNDLVVASNGRNPEHEGEFEAGQCYVVFGKEDANPVRLDSLGTGGFRIDGAFGGDSAGEGVAGAGDVNGDGLADLIVGAPLARVNGAFGAGQVYVVPGKTDADPVAVFDGEALLLRMEGELSLERAGTSVSGAGDANGDGAVDLAVGSDTFHNDPGRGYVLFNPLAQAASGTYRAAIPAGNAPRTAIGVVGDGSDSDSPSSRCWIDFDKGQGPGLANSSLQTVTLTRNDEGLRAVNPARLANVQWHAKTDRKGWRKARVTFKYTDAEIAGLQESTLRVWRAPSPRGPWSLYSSGLERDPERNRISVNVPVLGYFAIEGTPESKRTGSAGPSGRQRSR